MIPENVRAHLEDWAAGHESIARVWKFGSRATGRSTPESDLDVAIEIHPPDGQADAEWISEAKNWRRELTVAIVHPEIDLWPISKDDETVWPAVQSEGILIYER